MFSYITLFELVEARSEISTHFEQPHQLYVCFLLYTADSEDEDSKPAVEEDSKPAVEELESATAKRRSKRQGNLCSSKRTRLSKGAGKH